jgi:hypothetical protein
MEVLEEFPLRKCGTEQLRAAAEHGRAKGFNRPLPEEVVESLDANGVHVIAPFMIHNHADGEPVSEHLRCFAYLKEVDTMTPSVAIVDMTFSDVEMMEIAKERPNG